MKFWFYLVVCEYPYKEKKPFEKGIFPLSKDKLTNGNLLIRIALKATIILTFPIRSKGEVVMRTKLKITEGIFPMPVLMVATYNEDGSVNVMNAAWAPCRSGTPLP